MVPLWTEIVLIITILILFFITAGFIAHCIVEYFELERIRRTRRNRIVPLGRLIRIAQLRRQTENYQRYLLEQEKYDKVMAELKNKVIVVNPDNSLLLGIEH
jgi:hypothetical protein